MQSTEVEVVSEGCHLVKVMPSTPLMARATGHAAVRYRLGLPITIGCLNGWEVGW